MKDKEKVFIVSGSFSDWDDYHTRIFKVFHNIEDAERYVEKANRILKAMSDHIAEAYNNTDIDFDDEDITIEEADKLCYEYEQTYKFKKDLAIWGAHQNLQRFNNCYIQEVEII
jgi:hypothetical protein